MSVIKLKQYKSQRDRCSNITEIQKIKNIIVDVYRQNRYLNEQECFTENEHR